MSWKWAADRRPGRFRMDRRGMTLGLAGGIALAVFADALLPRAWFYAIIGVLSVGAISFDIWIRRRDPEERPSDD